MRRGVRVLAAIALPLALLPVAAPAAGERQRLEDRARALVGVVEGDDERHQLSARDRREQVEKSQEVPPGVTLYEVSERVNFDPDNGVVFRDATSPLLGFAILGSPLCPSELLVSNPRMESCTVIGTGTDRISTVTGLGPVTGTFDVVVNAPGNSAVHVPDLPVISGTFQGMVDLSLAVVHHVPLGSITGTFTITQAQEQATHVELSFSGTFRLPFGIDDLGRPERHDRMHAAFYLGDDFRTRIPVRPNERSVGFPTVRLEVHFGQ